MIAFGILLLFPCLNELLPLTLLTLLTPSTAWYRYMHKGQAGANCRVITSAMVMERLVKYIRSKWGHDLFQSQSNSADPE
jgi:hypothetical protein